MPNAHQSTKTNPTKRARTRLACAGSSIFSEVDCSQGCEGDRTSSPAHLVPTSSGVPPASEVLHILHWVRIADRERKGSCGRGWEPLSKTPRPGWGSSLEFAAQRYNQLHAPRLARVRKVARAEKISSRRWMLFAFYILTPLQFIEEPTTCRQ